MLRPSPKVRHIEGSDMIKVKGRYFAKRIELDQPLQISDGAEVELDVAVIQSSQILEDDHSQLGMQRLEEVWDNPEDAIYDNWKSLYADRLS